MGDSKKTRVPLIAGACLWAVAWVGVTYGLRQQLALRVAGQVLLALAVVATWISSRRLLHDRVLALTWFGTVIGAVTLGYLRSRDWWSLLLDAWCTWVMWRYIIRVKDAQGGPIRVNAVHSAGLAGTVEYESMRFSGVLVEECSPDWTQKLSEVKTDSGGGFALPYVCDAPVHYVRVSLPGTRTVHLGVTISPAAEPLLIRLKPAPIREAGNWGE